MPLGPLMLDLEGLELTEQEKTLLKHPMVGSIIFFPKNFKTPDQLRSLIKSIREIRSEILLSIDHEGGLVQRFQRRGFRTWPSHRVLGEIYKENKAVGLKMTRQYAEEMARELEAYSIDINLAPVLDLHTTSDVIGGLDRAFSENPDEVIEIGKAFIEGLRAGGVNAVGKHVPGHGICLGDSHVTKPSSDAELKDLCETHFKPFIALTSKGTLSALMPAHITYSKIDPNNVVSFSDKWLKDILPKHCGNNVALISDCLAMEGANIGTFPERSLRALNAGLDMIIICHQKRDLLLEVANTLQKQFVQSEASKQRLEALAGAHRKKPLQWLAMSSMERKIASDNQTKTENVSKKSEGEKLPERSENNALKTDMPKDPASLATHGQSNISVVYEGTETSKTTASKIPGKK